MLKNRHLLMAPEGDASSGAVAVNAEIIENVDPNETFDNIDYESEASKKAGEAFKDKFKERIERAKNAKKDIEEDEDEAPVKKEVKSKKGKDIDTLPDEDQMDLDGKAVKKEEKAKYKEEDDDDKEVKPDSEKSEEEKAYDKKVEKLKIRMSDGLYGIEKDAKVRVKIDGNYQEVPVQELINNYSGKVAYDKKFTEIGQKNKEVEYLKSEVIKTQEILKSTVSEIVEKLDDPNLSPFDALNILVEKSGRDPYTLWKRSIEANLETVEQLMSMSEAERKAFFLEKKDEFRTKSEEARKAHYAKEEAFNQAVQKVDRLRQAHGVSEEQYVKALDELEAQGLNTKKISDEEVVDYASLKPHIDDVQDVLEAYEEQIDDSKYNAVVQSFARQLRAKDFTKEQLAEWAKKEFVDEDLKDLSHRTKATPKTVSRAEVKSPEKLETLDFADY